MIRINVALILAILATSVVVINTQYDSRRLYTAVDQQSARIQVQRAIVALSVLFTDYDATFYGFVEF